MSAVFATLAELERRYDELERLMADPAVATDPGRLQEYGRERAELEEVVAAYRDLRSTDDAIAETELMAGDGDRELAELVDEELRQLRARREERLGRVRSWLVPRDPNDEKNVIVEILAGAGGEEAALFAYELFRMYQK